MSRILLVPPVARLGLPSMRGSNERTPAEGSAGVADSGSCYAHAINSCPAWAAAEGDFVIILSGSGIGAGAYLARMLRPTMRGQQQQRNNGERAHGERMIAQPDVVSGPTDGGPTHRRFCYLPSTEKASSTFPGVPPAVG